MPKCRIEKQNAEDAEDSQSAQRTASREGPHEGHDASFAPSVFFSALLKQIYIDQQYVPRTIYVPVDFEDRVTLEELLTEKREGKVQILVPQRGDKRSLIDLAGNNAKPERVEAAVR